ncbi:hypothetical protein PM035_00600 [Halorubrum ezzemoulense]|uniref:Uncharacterized protein n=1 Tax=Halorubrum ezzemoulense TaxID=337243 RepID=A0A256IZU7_HALEZ|nr:hypothetical protein [Halorubrum ezzemoulense]MDB2259380.1 hypothetical protein [Halorubrum ezzemoulense]MDB2266198.1 hypothetical protein [Halorubrum ezzemoulense]OYR62094.1 hypothetical protein DJ80_11130 [Halorubrum ezzemoulense]
MTGTTPIPPDAFATALRSLDTDALATLVADAYAATADAADADPPRVTVRNGDQRTELLVASAADGRVPDGPADAVVVASDSLLDEGTLDDSTVVSPADLRRRLLYAVPPAAADEIADRILGVPVRSASYDAVAPEPGAATDSGDGSLATDDEATDDVRTVDSASGDDASGDGDASDLAGGATAAGASGPVGRSDADRTDRNVADSPGASRADDRPSDSDPDPPQSGEPGDGSTADAASDRPSRRTVVAAIAVVALLVAAAGAGFAAGAAGIGGPGGIAGDDGAIDSPSDAGGSTDDGGDASGTDSDGGNTVSAADGDPTGEAARNTALSPTCERSALQVVQIQMNALRYNDNATNDGIRTLRAFASPENRQVVGPVGEYVELFETARYGPMLTYDTAEYSVPETADGTAAVEVVTREDGTVTGRYEFRLVRVGGGSATTNSSLGSVDDCWMTDAVTASGE